MSERWTTQNNGQQRNSKDGRVRLIVPVTIPIVIHSRYQAVVSDVSKRFENKHERFVLEGYQIIRSGLSG